MTPLLSTPFTFPDRPLWFGRIRLYPAHLRLTGWSPRGRYTRLIPLEAIQRTEWWTGNVAVNLALHLKGGETVPLCMARAAGTWKYELAARIGRRGVEKSHLPGKKTEKDAAA